MNSKRFLIKLSYLGFRYHGVQKQDLHQTVQERIENCLRVKFTDLDFKIKFSSRTDAMVSSLESYVLLMFKGLEDQVIIQGNMLKDILGALKKLPPDIQIKDVKEVGNSFTLLKSIGLKEYHYYFSHNISSPHIFAAPFMTILAEKLDIELMKQGAQLFSGTHNFENYCYKPKSGTQFLRTVESCEIFRNETFKGSFFPEDSYCLNIKAQGFMRGQVRLIMGSLFRLGKKELTFEDLAFSLKQTNPNFIKWLVPSPGLILQSTEINTKYS